MVCVLYANIELAKEYSFPLGIIAKGFSNKPLAGGRLRMSNIRMWFAMRHGGVQVDE